MKLTFLGTGTSQGVPVIGCDCKVCQSEDPRDQRLRTSALFETGSLNISIDSGPDFRQQMLREKVERLDAILYTHQHKDHVAGLDDVRPFNFRQRKPMDIYANAGTLEQIKTEFAYIFDNDQYPGVPKIVPHPIDREPFEVDGTEVIPLEVFHHKLPVLGFRIGDIAYITDANQIPETTLARMKGLRVLVLNALRKKQHWSHFTLEEAVHMAEKIKADHTYFTHISHLMGTHAEVSGELPPNVHLAYDGLQVEG